MNEARIYVHDLEHSGNDNIVNFVNKASVDADQPGLHTGGPVLGARNYEGGRSFAAATHDNGGTGGLSATQPWSAPGQADQSKGAVARLKLGGQAARLGNRAKRPGSLGNLKQTDHPTYYLD